MSVYMFVKSGGVTEKVFLEDIMYAEAAGRYVRIITRYKVYLSILTMSYVEAITIKEQFCRIHKSYIVSLGNITGFDKKSIFINNKELPVGRTYKDSVRKKLELLNSAALLHKQPKK